MLSTDTESDDRDSAAELETKLIQSARAELENEMGLALRCVRD